MSKKLSHHEMDGGAYISSLIYPTMFFFQAYKLLRALISETEVKNQTRKILCNQRTEIIILGSHKMFSIPRFM